MFATILFLLSSAGFEWITLPGNAREAALAYSALPSFFFPTFVSNPAGLSGDLFNLNYTNYLTGIQYGSISGIFGGYGASLSYFTSGEMKRMSEDGESLGSFSFSSLFLTLSCRKRFTPLLSFGGNLKILYAGCDTFRTAGIGFDLGNIISLTRARFGLLLRNLGFALGKFYQEKDKFPLTIRLDAGYLLFNNLEANLGLEKFTSYPVTFNFGLEGNIKNLLFLRGSYSSLKSDSKVSGGDILANFAFGLSIQKSPLRLDYSFSPFASLGNTHSFSLTFYR
uniref:PorV/PorQ family protein n=1 Tax=candidate division WOR-3 bacterium TaxID=2052148 RepID=A0A7C3UQB8_UNCW3